MLWHSNGWMSPEQADYEIKGLYRVFFGKKGGNTEIPQDSPISAHKISVRERKAPVVPSYTDHPRGISSKEVQKGPESQKARQ